MKKRKPNGPFGKGSKNIIIGLVLLIGVLFVLNYLVDKSRNVETVAYSTFLDKVDQDQVREVHISGQELAGVLKNGQRFEATVPYERDHDLEVLRKHGVKIVLASPSGQFSFWYLIPLLSLLFTGYLAWHFVRQSRGSDGSGGGPNFFSMGKSRAKLFMPSEIKDNFDSVAGAQEAKEELEDLVDFLRNPEKYKKLGAKITRGVLLVGAPGNGKTLLARAVAGEANCPFFSISGSDFVEVFVGVGASRVRDLFAQARKHAPCIIFIDEIDAVGRQRGSGMGGGHDEREQTLNQLLTEMDGFEVAGESVIVLAATNRPDVLDNALLRPGRFDRRVDVPYPDLKSREHILSVHAKKVKMHTDVDLKKIARGTPGFSGAELANLINEAAIIASKQNAKEVTVADLEAARDKLLLGKELKSIVLSDEDRKITSYHESGHALINLLLPEDTDPLHKLTIIPRGKALGVTHSLPEREKYTSSKSEMVANIMVALGGRAAEQLVFDQLYTGAYSDFQKASAIARNMICRYGMSDELGPVVYSQERGDFMYSQKTAELIDQEVKKLLEDLYAKTRTLLETNRDKLDSLAHVLLEKETLYAKEVYELLGITPRTEHTFL